MNSHEGERVFLLNGIQTLSAYQYNLINEMPALDTMGGDIARISADSTQAFCQLDDFRAQLVKPLRKELDGINECNGFWHKIAGMFVA